MAFVNYTDKASFHIHSRPGQFIKDFPDDRFAGFFSDPGFAGDGDAWRSSCFIKFHGAGLVERWHVVYLAAMNVSAIVGGKLIKLKLSPGLAAAWKQNKGRRMSETEAVRFVETKRREHALRQASPYLASRA